MASAAGRMAAGDQHVARLHALHPCPVREAELKERAMKLRIEETAWSELRSQLFRRHDVETAGLMLVESVDTTEGPLGLVRKAFALPEDAYAIRQRDQLSIDPIALNRLTRPAFDRKWGVFTIHTHPGASQAWFSQADNIGDSRLMPSLACRMPDARHGSLVIVDNGDVVARSFHNGSASEAMVQVIGKTISYLRASAAPSEPSFARQQLALGASGQARLRRLRVAIVGLGGIGSLVSMQLAHLGVGELILIDADKAEVSNLSRIAGATQGDIGKPKVEIAARYAEAVDFSKVEILAEDLSAETEGVLAGCDVIVSCVDRHTPRAILNHIAYRYLIPVIDLGTVFRVDTNGAISSDAGRVVVIGPGRPCLSCWGHLDPHALRIEALSDQEREAQLVEGYIDGATVAQPSVIAFNTVVAGAGVVELMRLATGFAGTQSPPLRLALSFTEGTVKRNSLAVSGTCGVCG